MIKGKYSLQVLFLALTISLSAQQKDLISSRHTSYYKYIYLITNKEARIIHKKSIHKVDNSFLHTLVDSLQPSRSQKDINLQPGNYLEVQASENKLSIEYFNVCEYSVHILDNKKDLCVQLFSKVDCSPVTDAEVWIRNKRIPLDKKTLTYRLKNTDKTGLLSIMHHGTSSFHRVGKVYPLNKINRFYRLVYPYTPLKYIYQPAYNLIALPIYSVRNLLTNNYNNPAWNYFRYTSRRIAGAIFPDGYFFYDRYRNDKYTGYMVFSKPMYRPGDTVDLKAFIIRMSDGKPLGENVHMYLAKRYDYYSNRQAPIFLGELSPYAPGGYTSRFIIADSLKMILDTDYEIRLTEPGMYGDLLISGSFNYSDYELKRNTLKVSVDKSKQWRGEPFTIHVIAKDDNGNAVPDCRIDLKLTTNKIFRFYHDKMFIPGVLLEKTIPLLNGSADIVIPDSVFPDVNMSYSIQASVLSADNEKMNWDTTVIYESHPDYLSIMTTGDSIRFSCSSFGLSREVEAEISLFDINNEELISSRVTLPYAEPLNRFCAYYKLSSAGINPAILELKDEKPQLQFFGETSCDSLFIISSNPRRIPFSWYLYKGDRLIGHGFDSELNYRRKNTGNDTYTLTTQYIWAGKEVSENVAIAKQPNRLNIKVNQPETVYPGQEAEVSLTVTDSKGKPVPDVDLTCFGITHKFGSQSFSIPSFENSLKGIHHYNSFHLKGTNDYSRPQTNRLAELDYPAFRYRYGLDTIEYYRFLYPGDTIYSYSYPAIDAITQVAPFIVDNGEIQPIKVLYIDSQPYYFNWVDVKEPYSFRVSHGDHTFRFVLNDREITLKSVIECKFGYKTIFSLDKNLEAGYVKTVKRNKKFTPAEIEKLSRYVFAYRGKSIPGRNSYLEQYLRVIPLIQHEKKSLTAGPLGSGITWFNVPKDMQHSFEPEPGFEYEFLPDVIKMRCIKPEQLVLNSDHVRKNLDSQVYTIKKQIADEIELTNSLRRAYTFDSETRKRTGTCVLVAQLDDWFKKNRRPLNILLVNCDSTSGNIYLQGELIKFENLDSSRYCLMILFEDDSYFFSDTIQVKPDGINYLKINKPDRFRSDNTGKQISETIVKTVRNPSQNKSSGLQNYFHSLINESKSYTGAGYPCKGRVVDKITGEPVPFASIWVKDTKYSTVSDIDGNFELNIPAGFETIKVSYVGFKPLMLKVTPFEFCLIELEATGTALEAFEVVDYKIPLSNNMITSASGEVSANSIQYIEGIRVRGSSSIPPDLIHSLSAKVAGVSISPNGFEEHTVVTNEFAANKIINEDLFNGRPMPEFFSSIRNRFNDCAYWEPKLRTNENGKISFKIKYPDDVTRWDTYVIAMNDKKQSGIASAPVFSYKPLLAQLYIPRFMVEGDTVKALGKTINYTKDTLSVRTSFELDGVNYGEHESSCSQVVIDSMFITASHADTLKVKYLLTKSDGYFDGEIRDLPVKPFGVEESEGVFMMFDHDTTFTLPQGPGGGSYNISADAEYLEVMRSDISSLHYYPYLCNEQLASKLRGLLAERLICKYRDEKFKGDKDVKKIIGKLVKNQNEQNGWGWWEVSQSVPWISTHVITTLLDAKDAGYAVNLNTPDIIDDLVYAMTKPSADKLEYLYLLSRLKADVNYGEHISKIENGMYLTTSQKLLLTWIKQAQDLPYSLDSVMKMSHRTTFGNYYWGSENLQFNLFENTVEATLRAYRVLEKDSAGKQYLPRIRAYLISQRKHNGWMNTYQNAGIIETLLPALLADGNKADKPKLEISGPVNCTVSEFPFTTDIKSAVPLRVSIKGNSPVYFTAFSKKWNPAPVPVDSLFRIHTELIQGDEVVNALKAGESTTLRVRLFVKKPSEYIKIEVPVPAGCSYDEKTGWYPGEQYREQYRDRTVIFCNKLNYGSYTFDIKLLPRYTGSFSLLPAVAELMYFPVFFGRNGTDRLRIVN